MVLYIGTSAKKLEDHVGVCRERRCENRSAIKSQAMPEVRNQPGDHSQPLNIQPWQKGSLATAVVHDVGPCTPTANILGGPADVIG